MATHFGAKPKVEMFYNVDDMNLKKGNRLYGSGFVLFKLTKDVLYSRISYKSFGEIFAALGGLYCIIRLCTIPILNFFVKKDYDRSLLKAVSNGRECEEQMKLVKERVSVEEIYKLYDLVGKNTRNLEQLKRS